MAAPRKGSSARHARKNSEELRKEGQDSATSVTKDFLLLSQPFIHQGILVTSASSGRRLFLHHLSELPLSEVYRTAEGNAVQRIDQRVVKLASSISIDVAPPPADLVPSTKLALSISPALFSAPTAERDARVLGLLQRGKEANAASDHRAACACFEAAYALSLRSGMLVSAANMRLKLGQPETAAAMYTWLIGECELSEAERKMATAKLAEAQGQGAGAQAQAPTAAAPGRKSAGGPSCASVDDDSWGAFSSPDNNNNAAARDDSMAQQNNTPSSSGSSGFGAFAASPAMPPAAPPGKPAGRQPSDQSWDAFSGGGGGGGGGGAFDADFDDFGDFDSGSPAPPAAAPTSAPPSGRANGRPAIAAHACATTPAAAPPKQQQTLPKSPQLPAPQQPAQRQQQQQPAPQQQHLADLDRRIAALEAGGAQQQLAQQQEEYERKLANLAAQVR